MPFKENFQFLIFCWKWYILIDTKVPSNKELDYWYWAWILLLKCIFNKFCWSVKFWILAPNPRWPLVWYSSRRITAHCFNARYAILHAGVWLTNFFSLISLHYCTQGLHYCTLFITHLKKISPTENRRQSTYRWRDIKFWACRHNFKSSAGENRRRWRRSQSSRHAVK